MTEPKRVGKYEIIEEIGRGGFATVYRARDTRMGREVALKVIAGNFAQEPAFIERFQQEARTAANLRHPRIVTVYEFGDADGTLYLAMALIGEGRTLRDLLAEQAPLSLEQALAILAQLADALDYLHRHDPPLAHRDVKPANVLLEGEGDNLEIVLTDFGLVRSMEASTELTRTGTILGTPAYMAPEQADPKQWGETTPLTDVYALGVVVYEMFTGRVPFEGETATLLHAHAYDVPPSPLEFVSDLGDDLTEALLRALAKSPAERYPSAGALVATLQEIKVERRRQATEQVELTHLSEQAQAARQAGDWLSVQRLCVRIMQLDRANPDALTLMAEATKGLQKESAREAERRRLVRLYEEGEQALAVEQWQAAVKAFAAVFEGNPDFREVQERLAQARDELQCAQWYDEAIAHGEAERWAEACRLWVKVLRGRLGYRDGDAAKRLLETTEGVLAQLKAARAELEKVRGENEALRARVAELETKLDEAQAARKRVEPEAKKLRSALKTAQSQVDAYDSLIVAMEDHDRKQMLALAEDLAQAKRSGASRLLARLQAEPVAPLGDRWTSPQDGKEMVRIPAGEFLYGAKKKAGAPEFWIDKTPVTNAEYARFVTDTGHEPPEHWKGKTPPKKIADHPVTYVSWHDAVAYAQWAGKRLPTEEEWEKAARGTDGRQYPWGDQEPTRELCNFGENEGGTTPVGKYSPQGDSSYGCVDMAGNVWEWTASDYSKDHKVLRGGSWLNVADLGRGAIRHRNYPDNRDNSVGFRCARGFQ